MNTIIKKILIAAALSVSVMASAQLTITQAGIELPLPGGPQIWTGVWSSRGVSHTVTGSTYRQCQSSMTAQTRYLQSGYYNVVRECSL